MGDRVRLRIARKIAKRIGRSTDLDVYADVQLWTAARKLGLAWARARDSRPSPVLATITRAPAVTDDATGLPLPDAADYFAAHLVTSLRLRQARDRRRARLGT